MRFLKNNYIFNFLKRVMLTTIVVLLVLIVSNVNKDFKNIIIKYAFNTNYNFSKFNNLYNKYILSLNKLEEKVKEVNADKLLDYKSKENYLGGVLLEVDEVYNVRMLESGLVVFIGEKDGIGNTIIVQQRNGIDATYGFVTSSDIKMYDYVEKGCVIGVSNKKVYLSFTKNGQVVSYEPYI